jgi:hypothetical protein
MNEEKRLISINPELFKVSSNSTRKNQKKNDKTNIKIRNPLAIREKNNKTLKHNLIKYLRRKKENQDIDIPKEKGKTEYVSDFESNFDESMNYLLKLTKELELKKKQQDPKNHTLKQYPNQVPYEQVNLSLPSILNEQPPHGQPQQQQQQQSQKINYPSNVIEPKYGCLKGGNLPTYKIWKNKTEKVYSTSGTQNHKLQSTPITKPMVINEMASTPLIIPQKPYERLKIEQMKQIKQKEPPKPKRPKQKQKTLRRVYRVGKSKIYSKISVLVSNKTIRKNIMSQTQLLKQTPIQEVKQYLIKKGFIRIGSIAPNDVLRKMYETAKTMCGEIQNHNPENLLFNFLNGEDK